MPEPRCIACAARVPWVTFAGNVFLTIYKLALGLIGKSSALMADGIHSFTDVIGTIAILISYRVGGRPADGSHPYGHAKVEFLSSAFIYLLLLFISLGIAVGGVLVIVHGVLHPPSLLTMFAGIISIGFNAVMYWMGQCAGRRMRSPALLANSFENRADAISSAAVVVGIGLALVVHPVCDPLAAIVVGIVIFINCIEELGKALSGLMDRGLPSDIADRIRSLALSRDEVDAVTFVRSRHTGNQYWLDLGIQVGRGTSMQRATALASELRSDLMQRLDQLGTVEIFVSPSARASAEPSPNLAGGAPCPPA